MGKRDNGSGTIRKVTGANGVRYYAYAPARYEIVNGAPKCIREPLGGFKKRSDARATLDAYARKPLSKYNYTLQQTYEEWKTTAFQDIEKSTRDNYTAAWAQIELAAPLLMDTQMLQITTGQLRQIFDYWMSEHEVTIIKGGQKKTVLKGPLGKSSMQKIKALLTQLYDYAMANKICDMNYASLVKIPRSAQSGTKRAFTDAEFQTLQKNWSTVSKADAVYALCYLGFRVTEFCLLTPSDYDPNTKTLRGGIKTEAGHNRIVPVHPNIVPIIEKWVGRGCEALYADESGKPYNKDRFKRGVWEPAIRALGLSDDLKPHSARHTCATRLSAAGVKPEDIQMIMGHADFSVTANTYINQDIGTLISAMQKVT